MTAKSAGPATGPMRSFEAWKRSIRDFSWLKDAAPGGMDVDFFVERGGNFLVLESKPYHHGVHVPYGQHLALFRLSKLPEFRVYLIGEGKTHLHIVRYCQGNVPQIVRRGRGVTAYWPPEAFIPTDKEGLRDLVAGWWEDHETVQGKENGRG